MRIGALVFLMGWSFLTLRAGGAELWVSPGGNNRNPGTEARPFATISRALQKGRELRKSANATDVQATHIVLREGIYALKTTLTVRPADSGSSDSSTIISAAPGE